MDKKTQRGYVLKRRDSLTERERKQWSVEITEQVKKSPFYIQAECVLSYASFRSEVETERLNNAIIQDGKKLYLPKTYPDTGEMKFFRVRSMDFLQKGYQGISEPQENGESFEEVVDGKALMIMPGVAFDTYGNRLGYGGGYYDRYLEKFGEHITCRVMLAYQIQKEQEIICNHLDKKPDYIISN
ncbi:MAG: 5-formyltetrahydrofolate cyclo-ligase [Eubacterium sp.]|nr:5-formyltetrahydrofolate cyclo-ligase [Eubacterium sp.]